MKSCPFPFCPRPRWLHHFACRGHWDRMPAAMRSEAIDLMRKMDTDDISPAKFAEMRDAIVSRCPGAFLHAPEFNG
jgi:hypothetical protein